MIKQTNISRYNRNGNFIKILTSKTLQYASITDSLIKIDFKILKAMGLG